MFITLSLSSCIGTKYNYSFRLSGDNAKTDEIFNDGKIEVFFFVGDKQLDFTMKNLTSEPIKLHWDEASLVIFGESKRVIHKGVKFFDRNSAQVPTVIPSNSSIEDLVLPIENVIYNQAKNNAYNSNSGNWEIKDLLPMNDKDDPGIRGKIFGMRGSTIRFFLPIEQHDKKINYTFEILITDVKPR
jgi:hypothetical protein